MTEFFMLPLNTVTSKANATADISMIGRNSSRELFERMDFKVIKTWITHDARKGREDEKWINILVER